jgi:hypothetical protein
MNPEIKRKWVEALRSGRFRQGQGFLKKDDVIYDPNDPLDVPPTPVQTYCCLGVLCELAAEEGVLPGTGKTSPTDRRYHYGAEHDLRWSDLPIAVQEWAGTDRSDPIVPGHGRLSTLNDNGSDFEYIANLIESYL